MTLEIRALFVAGMLGALVLIFPIGAQAQPRQVSLAGLSYAGDAETLKDRFTRSNAYVTALERSGDKAYKHIQAALSTVTPRDIQVVMEELDDLKGRDQALVVSLLITSETVSIERLGGETRKLFILIRGQAIFFDFKLRTVIRSYPLSFAYIDNFNHEPTEPEIQARVRIVYEGAGNKPGLYGRFANAIAAASVPNITPRFLQVTKVKLSDDLVSNLPTNLQSSPAVYETWAADLVSEAISTRVGVPMIPYLEGDAVKNVMSVRIATGEVLDLKLPTPDYEISVDFTGLKKVTYSQTGAGASFVYGSYATVKILENERGLGTVYMNTALKNGEVKVVPASQTTVDDFPAYYDSINGLFVKLADAIAGKGNAWVKGAAAAPDIEAQILKTRGMMNLCK